jgi:serine/threonine protein kinase HipA of HipAB toxin-antitoxin module
MVTAVQDACTMRDEHRVDHLASIEAILREAQSVHDRAEEYIRKSEETLRAAKATLTTLREKLRRIA